MRKLEPKHRFDKSVKSKIITHREWSELHGLTPIPKDARIAQPYYVSAKTVDLEQTDQLIFDAE